MKHFSSIILGAVCVVLVIALIMTKHSDNTQHDSDVGAINDFSNQLDLAQMHVSICNGTALIFSNSLNESVSTALTFSNQLSGAQSTIALDAQQITNLSRQVMEAQAENQASVQRLLDLAGKMTNEVDRLTRQLAAAQASLLETNKNLVQLGKDYALLENRFRVDVAERVVVERKFNNLHELQVQLRNVKQNPPGTITTAGIYAGLNVEVKSDGTFHVIAPK